LTFPAEGHAAGFQILYIDAFKLKLSMVIVAEVD